MSHFSQCVLIYLNIFISAINSGFKKDKYILNARIIDYFVFDKFKDKLLWLNFLSLVKLINLFYLKNSKATNIQTI